MTEHPILFSASMVRAILDGSKTQTRRVINPQPRAETYRFMRAIHALWLPVWSDAATHNGDEIRCPYGQPGDRLWVRETFHVGVVTASLLRGPNFADVKYKAGGSHSAELADEAQFVQAIRFGLPKPKWRPCIHMPRWACRLTPDVLDVRAQRVQDISEEDIYAEGIVPIGSGCGKLGKANGNTSYSTARSLFWQLWDSINGKKPGRAWADNPWVWAVTFRRREPDTEGGE